MQVTRKQLIIIHGWAGSYRQAAHELLELISFKSFWEKGHILVPAKVARMLRHVLRSQLDIPGYKALCKLIISRFLLSPPVPRLDAREKEQFSSFSEDRLRVDFPDIVIPLAPNDRQQHAKRLQKEATDILDPTLQVLKAFQARILQHKGSMDENSMRILLKRAIEEIGTQENPIALLEAMREMHETGGDLDTVATAVFYALSLQQAAKRENRPFRYGYEYEFVFLNYHESFRHLVQHAPADLHAGDLPIAAFPALEEDIVFLHQNDVVTINFDDHHPYDPQRKASLEDLVTQGMLKHLWLSGPEVGQELPPGTEKCAADMVFESKIAGTDAEYPAARKLVKAAHGEDFVTNRSDFGRLLTDLIKGGTNKTELAQILLSTMEQDTAEQELQKRGWSQQPAIWQGMLKQTMHQLNANVAMMTLKGSKDHILCAKAVHSAPDMPKISTGRAIQFLADSFPEADYIFYCFGINLMVARRIHSDNTLLNLGHLMPAIGTASDGGHAGAAVCRPSANPAFPTNMFAQLSDDNFISFTKYLAARLQIIGYKIESIQDLSRPESMDSKHDKKKLFWILLASLGVGLALLTFFPSYRPQSISSSNASFYPHITTSSHAVNQEDEP
jgi:hypothetical protein